MVVVYIMWKARAVGLVDDLHQVLLGLLEADAYRYPLFVWLLGHQRSVCSVQVLPLHLLLPLRLLAAALVDLSKPLVTTR